jgi:hypothetical protein
MKNSGFIPVVTVLNLIWFLGCEPPATSVPDSPERAVPPTTQAPAEPASLHLDFVQGRQTRYRLQREYRKQVAWQGVPEDRAAALKDGTSVTDLVLGFTQEVVRVDASVGADLKITVTDLAYRHQVNDRVALDFDSQRPADANHPLAGLAGSAYRITLSSMGQVSAVSGLEELRQRFGPDTPTGRMAQRLFSEPVVRDRHTISALAGRSPGDVRVGDTWQVSAVEDFQEMGKQSFLKLYSLEAWDASLPGVRKAVLALRTEPSTRGLNGESSHPFAGMMDSEQDFSGRWELDLSRGEVAQARETLTMTWRVAVPAGSGAPEAPPVLSVMTAHRHFHLERLERN